MTTPLIRYKKVQFKHRELILDQKFLDALNEKHLSISTRANPNHHPEVYKGSKYVGKLYNVLGQYYGKEFVGFRSENINDFRMRNIVLQ